MNEIATLKKTPLLGREFSIYGTFDAPWFFAKDVADILGLKNVSDMVSRVEDGERSKFNLGRQGESWFISEDGLYELLMQSRKPLAKEFKKGVKAILKEIRQNGGYIAAKVDESPEAIMARALQVADATLKRQKQQIASLEAENEVKQQRIDLQTAEIKKAAPKVEYYDQCLQSTASFTTTQVAKELGLTANSLNRILQDHHIIYKQSGQFLLYTAYIKWGLHAVRTYAFVANSGEVITSHRTVWTERGRRFIIALAHNGYNVKAAIAAINGADAK